MNNIPILPTKSGELLRCDPSPANRLKQVARRVILPLLLPLCFYFLHRYLQHVMQPTSPRETTHDFMNASLQAAIVSFYSVLFMSGAVLIGIRTHRIIAPGLLVLCTIISCYLLVGPMVRLIQSARPWELLAEQYENRWIGCYLSYALTAILVGYLAGVLKLPFSRRMIWLYAAGATVPPWICAWGMLGRWPGLDWYHPLVLLLAPALFAYPPLWGAFIHRKLQHHSGSSPSAHPADQHTEPAAHR